MVMVIPDRPIFIWGKQQFEFLILAHYVKGIRVPVIILIDHDLALLGDFHGTLRLKQDEPKISLETLFS